MELLHFNIAGERDWKRDECAHQTTVNLLRSRSCQPPWCVENAWPIDCLILGHGSESNQIRKELLWPASVVQDVFVPDLGMSIAVCRIGELERNERLAARMIIARSLLEQGSH